MVLGLVLPGILLLCPCALALNLALDINQFAHTAWKTREGFSKGAITSIAQTPDGYLWLGTEFGLFRFDGVRSVSWEPSPRAHLPSSHIRTLITARDGSLWIGTAEGLASWKDNKLTLYPQLNGWAVDALLEDHDGTVWAGGQAVPAGKLCAIHGSSVNCYGEDGILGQHVESLYEDSRGNLWVGTTAGLWRWKPGPPKRYPMADTVQSLIEDENGALLIAMRSGIRQFVNGKAEEYPLAVDGHQFTPRELLRDGKGGLWIGTTDRGILHVHQGRTDVFAQSDGLSGDFIERIFADREGTVWAATLDGLDRFRDLPVSTISEKQGLSNSIVESVLAAKDGSVWLGTVDGLNRWNNGQITIYRNRSVHGHPSKETVDEGVKREQGIGKFSEWDKQGTLGQVREIVDTGLPDNAIESLYEDDQHQIWVSTHRGVAYFANGRFISVTAFPGGVHSIAGDGAGSLWVSQDQSLFHLVKGNVVEQIPWAKLGRGDAARCLVADTLQGGLWLGFRDGGVAYFKGGRIRASYESADGLGEGHIRGLHLDRDGTLWASIEGGLSRVKNGRIATLTSKNGLPCDSVHWVMEDDNHSFWLYMACGLVRIARPELDAWVGDPKRTIQATVFDSSDGVRSHATTTGYSPSVAKSADGALWFLPWDGVSVIDPRHLAVNSFPPPVHIEQITVDRKTHDVAAEGDTQVSLPPLVRDLEIDYTALSLVAPEKVQFRYKLEGWDQDWQDAGNRRQAFYTGLQPRNYRFRVIASNNSGVWNETGAALEFNIAPAYYQTNWFLALCMASALALLYLIYDLRLKQVARLVRGRMEERLGERERIARDLHDTFLQSVQGLILKFAAVSKQIPREQPAHRAMEDALDLADQVLDEGRDRVRNLRGLAESLSDLPAAFRRVAEESPHGNTIAFRAVVEGSPRELHPLVLEESFSIGREALTNALTHSGGLHVETEITYDARQFRLRIRDDGRGIDPAILEKGGLDNHWGLQGMRERASRIGAQLEFWSRPGTGAEVELRVPAVSAYQAGGFKKKRFWFRRAAGVDGEPL